MRTKTLALFPATLALLVAISGPALAGDETVSCDGLQNELSDPTNSGHTITVVDNEPCVGSFTIVEGLTDFTLEGGLPDKGQVLDGGQGGPPILWGSDVGQTTIQNFTFRNADNEGDGGGIYLTGNDTAPTIQDNVFESNFAARGGAVAIDTLGDPPPSNEVRGIGGDEPVVLQRNTFGGDGVNNAAFSRGGAVYIFTHHPVQFLGNDFFNNGTIDGSGGGAYVVTIDGPLVEDNDFFGNFSQKRGGGATFRWCGGTDPANVTNNVFDDNDIQQPNIDRQARVETRDGPLGAGLHLTDECQFGRVAPRGTNGGPDVDQSGNDFVNNTIHARTIDNRPPGGGGGEAIQGLHAVSTSDYYYNNEVTRTGGEGGGLYVETHFGEPFEGRNLVAASNEILSEPEPQIPSRGPEGGEPTGDGGGVYFGRIDFPGELRLYDSTLVNNVADNGSGIDGGGCDGLTLYNSIVYGNTGHNIESGDIDGFNFLNCELQSPQRAGPGERDVQFTDTCDPSQSSPTPHPGDGNICADPLLVNPGGGDIKQTSGSPTRNTGSNDLVPGDLSADFFGAARIAEGRVDMGAHEFQPSPAPTPTPTPAAQGCLNSEGGVSGGKLGPVLLGRRRAAQREAMLGARLLTRFGMDKYCVTGGGLFRIGYPTARINRTIGRSLRRAVADRVVIALTSSPRFNVSGIVPSQTSGSTARRRLRGERRFVIGKNTWLVTGAPRPVGRAQAGVMRLIKVQRGLVREVGIGDRRLARGDRKQLKRYLKTWQALGF